MRNDKAQKPCYNITGDGFYNLLKGYTWLRSGADPDSYYAYYHSAVGMSYTAAYPERTLAVRPALYKKASPWGRGRISQNNGYPLFCRPR